MKNRDFYLQNGIFVYKPGISFTKQDFHLQIEILGLQTGFSACYLPLEFSGVYGLQFIIANINQIVYTIY
jgi:hypothetical protein